MAEKSAEEKAREAKLILKEQLDLLSGAEGERLERAKKERIGDEARGKVRGEELFGEGALGRIGEDTSPEALALQKDRQGSLIEQRAASEQDVAGRQSELDRGSAELDKLISSRMDPDSELAKLQRSKRREEINRALQGQLGQVRSAGNLSSSGVNQALVGDALGGALQARAGMERDILMGGLDAAERLSLEKEGLRERGTTRKEDLRASGRAEESALRSRLEGIQGAIQDDTMRRQLINLDQRKQELFGRLSTEQNLVSQGVAERSGVRSQILAEVGQAESTRAQREAESLQEREVNKPTPEAGGKVICGELNRQGLLDDNIYAGDMDYASRMLVETVAGYHSWAVPFVKLMRCSKIITLLAAPIARAWATEMAFRRGYVKKGSLLGKVLSAVGEPVCKLIGNMIKLYRVGV